MLEQLEAAKECGSDGLETLLFEEEEETEERAGEAEVALGAMFVEEEEEDGEVFVGCC